MAESVAAAPVLPDAAARSPLGFYLLQVLRLLAVRAPSRPFRSWPFATPTEVSIAWVFSVFSAWEPNRSLSRPADLPEVSCLPGYPGEASAPPARPEQSEAASSAPRGRTTSAAHIIAAATPAADVLERRERLQKIKRRVAEAARPAARIDPAPDGELGFDSGEGA